MTLPPSSPSGPHGGGVDPSMEDILASIRRILSEDEADPPPPAAPSSGHDVVPLDHSMLVEESPAPQAPPPAAPPSWHEPEELPTVVASPSVPSPPPSMTPPPPEPPLPAATVSATTSLLGAEAAAKASSSVGSLLRTLASERQQVAVRSGGPTIEDLVREEIRPLLKTWLDTNLPPMVERLVRAEIERVVGRALS